jgi:hypothetical protein
VGTGGCPVAREFEEVRTNGVHPVVAGECGVGFGLGELVQSGPRSVHHRDRDDPVERHHRAGRGHVEEFVQAEDLRPVGVFGAWCLVVHGGDRGLQLVRADGRAGPARQAG